MSDLMSSTVESLKVEMMVNISGFPANNAPFTQTIQASGEDYDWIMYPTLTLEGTAAGAQDTVVAHKFAVTGSPSVSGQNAYLLPWGPNKLFMGELGQKHDLFFTHTLNGCAVFIAGGRCNPTVVHANTKSDQVFGVQEQDQILAAYKTIYEAMANFLVARGFLDGANLKIFWPKDYMSKAAVFGVRRSSNWEFYANTWRDKAITQIWG